MYIWRGFFFKLYFLVPAFDKPQPALSGCFYYLRGCHVKMLMVWAISVAIFLGPASSPKSLEIKSLNCIMDACAQTPMSTMRVQKHQNYMYPAELSILYTAEAEAAAVVRELFILLPKTQNSGGPHEAAW